MSQVKVTDTIGWPLKTNFPAQAFQVGKHFVVG